MMNDAPMTHEVGTSTRPPLNLHPVAVGNLHRNLHSEGGGIYTPPGRVEVAVGPGGRRGRLGRVSCSCSWGRGSGRAGRRGVLQPAARLGQSRARARTCPARARLAQWPSVPHEPPAPVAPPDPPPAGCPRADRVRHCRQLMGRGFWVTGLTGLELAEHWGLEEATVQADAAEASRQLKDALPDAEGLRQHCLGVIERAKAEAQRTRWPEQRAKLLLEATKLAADISGCAAPRKQQVQLSQGSGDEWLEPEGE